MGVVLLSQILTIISYITAFYRRFNGCFVFFYLDRLFCFFAMTSGNGIFQCNSFILIHRAHDFLSDTLSGGNCDVVPCCFAGGGQSIWQGIVQGNGTVSITAIGHGDNKLDLVALYIVRLFVFHGLAQTELRPLRSRNFQFHAVSADGRVAGIVTIGLAGNSQAVGDLAVRGAVHLHGAAVQRQCHVQLDCGHFCIGALAVHGEADLGSTVADIYAQVAGGVASRLNRSLHCALDSSLCIFQELHIFQRNGVLEFQGLHPFHAVFLGGVVRRSTQGIIYRGAGSQLCRCQGVSVLRLGRTPLPFCLGSNCTADALACAVLYNLYGRGRSPRGLAVLELRQQPNLFGLTVVKVKGDIPAAVAVDMQGIAVINCPVLKAVSGEVRQQQILVGDLDPIRILLSFIDVVSGDRRH